MISKKSKFRLLLEGLLRVVLLTIVATLLCFALGLLVGILGTVLYSLVRHVRPDMTMAYRHVAAPVAILGGTIAFIVVISYEVRRFRQNRIERFRPEIHSV